MRFSASSSVVFEFLCFYVASDGLGGRDNQPHKRKLHWELPFPWIVGVGLMDLHRFIRAIVHVDVGGRPPTHVITLYAFLKTRLPICGFMACAINAL